MNRTEIHNYADDLNIYVWDSKIENAIVSLEQYATQLSTWYPENCMKPNVDKCHLMTFGEKTTR